jgi:cytochrome oxidase Cu insertion factor (SCO1/SenC/PrrC family)
MARVALLLIALATLAACGGSGGADQGGAGSPATTVGQTAQAGVKLEGETLDGERLSLADLRGKPVFVNVWASW